MKKLLLLLPVIVFTFVFCGKTIQKDEAHISGKITNPKGEVVIIYNYEISDTTEIDSLGEFNMLIKISEADYITFKHGKESTVLFLTPGDDIKISLNAEEFDETIKYEGVGADANNFLAEKYMAKELAGFSDYEIYKLDSKEFIEKLNSEQRILIDKLNSIITKNKDLSPKFIKLENANLLYDWAIAKKNYPQYFSYFHASEEFEELDDDSDYESAINLNDSTLLESSLYTQYLTIATSSMVSDKLEMDSTLSEITNSNLVVTFNVIAKNFTDIKIKDHLYFTMLNDHLKYSGANDLDAIIEDFNTNCTNSSYKEIIKEEYGKWKVLTKGNKAPVFKYMDIDSNMVSLSDFLGKLVYIDVWATWCGPCRGEIPFLETLEEEFKGKNIEFISVSVDDNKEAWETMVKEKEMKGTQLFTGGWKTSITKDYLINSIPRFILIDKEGNIINVNADRPSGNIKEIIEEYLK